MRARLAREGERELLRKEAGAGEDERQMERERERDRPVWQCWVFATHERKKERKKEQ